MTTLPDYLGTYRRSRFIRAGNSCQIWECIKDGGGRFVLKVLRREHWGKREQIGYLKHEYEVAHSLSHPNVIGMHEFSTDGKITFLVLELFTDLNLKQALRSDYPRVVYHFSKIAEQSASALQHLHEHKWVHCDVKPDNFLLNDEAHVKLIDFTIAQRISKNPLTRMFNRPSRIQGTRSYMSPEQIRRQPLDARADIYSFGCLMYELLANRPPYTGVSPDDLLNKHLRAAIPTVLVYNNLVTNELAELIGRTMSKRPEDRPQSMADLLKELRSVRHFKSPPTWSGATGETNG
jgi:serine/threonine protein kinase